MTGFARGFIAVVLLCGIIVLGTLAPIGQLTFIPLILLTALFVLAVTAQMGEAHVATPEVRTINAAPTDYPEWAWPTVEDHPWSTDKEGGGL